MDAVLTYDGTTLTLVLTDTVTAATTRISWPVNIAAIVGANTAYVGFTTCQPNTTTPIVALKGWKWYAGHNTELVPPTFSVTPGQYSSTQSVSLSGPSGATIYYTTDGTPPTTASTQYTGTPISVSTSQVINAVAVEPNFTDSPVAQGNYQIQSGGSPTINFPSGFAGAHGLIQTVGYSSISGPNIVLTDTAGTTELGAAWYAAPITLSTNWSTTFHMTLTNVSGNGAGMAFVLQNYPVANNANTNYNLQLGQPSSGISAMSGGQ